MVRGDPTGPGNESGRGTPGASGSGTPGGRTSSGGAGRGSETRGSEPRGSETRGSETRGSVGQATRSGSPGTRLAWIALAVAGVLTAWQVVYSLTSPTTPNPETYSSVSLLLTLVLSVGAIVLGIVALGQRALPRWPATAATAMGVFAFIVCVATWIGTLMV